MTSEERPREAEALSLPRVDAVVHLGAGPCSELDAYLHVGAQRILLIEADSQIAEALGQRTAALPQVQVMPVAVAARPGSGLFHRYSLPGFGSLHPATGLKRLFPGLKDLEPLPLEILGADAVIASLGLDGRQGNLLVLETGGEELPILEALDLARQLSQFSEVRLYCGRDPLYEGGLPAADILGWLGQRGYDLVAEDVSQDPDRPCWVLQRSPLQARASELELQAHRLTEELHALRAKADTLRSQLTDQRHETEIWKESAAAAEVLHQQEMLQLSAKHDEQTRLLLERETLYERLEGERAELLDRWTQHQAELEALRAERDDQARRLQETLGTMQGLSTAKEVLQAAVDDLRAQLIEQQRQTTHWQGEVEALKAQAEESASNALQREAEHRQELLRLAEIQQEQGRALQERDARLEQLHAEHTQTLVRLEETLLRLGVLEREKDSLAAAGEVLGAKIAARDAELDAMRVERDQQATRLEDSLRALESLELERQSLRGDLDDLREQLVEQQRQTMVWHEEVNTLRAELAERQTRIERLAEERSRQEDDWELRLKELAQARERAEVLATIAEQRASAQVSRANARAEELKRQLEESERRVERMTREEEERAASAEDTEAQLLEQRRHTEYWISECKTLQGEAEQLKSELEGWEKEVAAQRERAEGLELRLNEKDRRQHLLDEELIKAEAQIDLIKDILIREKAF